MSNNNTLREYPRLVYLFLHQDIVGMDKDCLEILYEFMRRNQELCKKIDGIVQCMNGNLSLILALYYPKIYLYFRKGAPSFISLLNELESACSEKDNEWLKDLIRHLSFVNRNSDKIMKIDESRSSSTEDTENIYVDEDCLRKLVEYLVGCR